VPCCFAAANVCTQFTSHFVLMCCSNVSLQSLVVNDSNAARPTLAAVIVIQWSGSGGTEAYLSGQLAVFSALTLLVGSSGL